MKLLYALCALLLINTSISAQTTFTNTDDSKVVVQGTSTVHDWESQVEEFSVVLKTGESASENFSIQSLTFTAETKSVKEGKRVMDKKTRSALQAKDHPQITFEMTELGEVTADSVKVKGNLTIAGVSKPVELSAAYTLGEMLTVNGSYSLLMSDYGIDAPTAMMGTLKTGDEVTLAYDLILKQN